MNRLKSLVEDTNTKAGKIFDISIQILILASLISFAIGTIPDLSGRTQVWLRRFEIFCVIAFTIEYVLRIVVSDKKWSYIFSF